MVYRWIKNKIKKTKAKVSMFIIALLIVFFAGNEMPNIRKPTIKKIKSAYSQYVNESQQKEARKYNQVLLKKMKAMVESSVREDIFDTLDNIKKGVIERGINENNHIRFGLNNRIHFIYKSSNDTIFMVDDKEKVIYEYNFRELVPQDILEDTAQEVLNQILQKLFHGYNDTKNEGIYDNLSLKKYLGLKLNIDNIESKTLLELLLNYVDNHFFLICHKVKKEQVSVAEFLDRIKSTHFIYYDISAQETADMKVKDIKGVISNLKEEASQIRSNIK